MQSRRFVTVLATLTMGLALAAVAPSAGASSGAGQPSLSPAAAGSSQEARTIERRRDFLSRSDLSPQQRQNVNAGFLGDAWQVTKCGAAITVAAFPGGVLFKAVKGAGSIKKFAEVLVSSGSKKAAAGLGVATEILAIDAIESNCF